MRDYTYTVGEDDSRNTARTNAIKQMQKILLQEIGTFIRSEQQTTVQGDEQDYTEKIEAITAGIVEMNVLEENFTGATFYIKAEITIDPDDVNKRIAEVLNDKQKDKALEESLNRAKAAEAENERLRNENLALQKANQQKDEASTTGATLPDWFLSPQTGEYVGVSLPLKDASLAKQQAVYSALLSYMLQHDIEGQLKSAKEEYSNVTGIASFLTVQKLTSVTLALPDNYEITKTTTNRYGEVFVAIRVLSPVINSKIKMLSEGYDSSKEDENGYTASYTSEFALKGSSAFSVYVKLYQQEDKAHTAGEVSVSIENNRVNEKTALDDRSNYQYQSTNTHSNAKNTLGVCNTKQSLGMAYLTSLLQGLSNISYWTQPIGDVSFVINLSHRKASPIVSMEVSNGKLSIFTN
jgi:hypothetical protein